MKAETTYLAFVDIDLAARSCKSRQAYTLIDCNTIDTCSIILARIRFAFVYVDITVFSY